MIVAHIAGVPVEEALLLAVTGGAGGTFVLARAWLSSRRVVLRRRGEEARE